MKKKVNSRSNNLTSSIQDTGFIYRGSTKVVIISGYTVKLVKGKTYVIPHFTGEPTMDITLFKKGKSIHITITNREYYTHISTGRLNFKDENPYCK